MFDESIILLHDTETINEYGDQVTTTVERRIFAQVKSISQTEFYQAQAIGLRPEIKFVIADFFDYQGEQRLKYTPFGGTEQIYEVLRTFRTNVNLEIVCRRGIE